jgi:hypothetical protein
VERRSEGLTTDDLAGARPEDDIRIEEDERADAGTDYDSRDRLEDSDPNRGSSEAIAVGPAGTADESSGAARQEAARKGDEIAQPPEAGREGTDAVGPLIDENSREEFVAGWKEIQYRFVEEPRGAVQEADGLVAGVMQTLAQMFADERAKLESQWSRGDEVSTEELRQAFRRYREFFDRLLQA